MSQDLMVNQCKEANMPQTADQGIAVATVEGGDTTEDDLEDHLDQRELEKRKVTKMMIKKNLKLRKDPSVHTDEVEGVAVEVATEDVEVLEEDHEAMDPGMKILLKMKDVK